MDWIVATISSLTAWLADHPAGVAWLLGWIAALGAAQSAKALLFPTTWAADRVKRAAQAVAIIVGGGVAWALWPNGIHRAVLALVVGMSAPTAYTFGKAVIEWRFPSLADALSWQGVKRRGDGQPHNNED